MCQGQLFGAKSVDALMIFPVDQLLNLTLLAASKKFRGYYNHEHIYGVDADWAYKSIGVKNELTLCLPILLSL